MIRLYFGISDDGRRAMTQAERRLYLIRELLKEENGNAGFKPGLMTGNDGDFVIPADEREQRDMLRALMNVREPLPVSDEFLKIQDEYLQQVNKERGITDIADLKPTERNPKFYLWQGDITTLKVDAIVNAANSALLGCFAPLHICIDNCIHTFAGVQLRAECNRQMTKLRDKYGADYEQPTAVPMLTDAYNLPAKKIVHIVGPIVEDRLTPALEQDLADCYRNTLDLCAENALRSVAFCCISTGVFRFPNQRAAEIAVETVSHWLAEHKGRIDRVIFNVFKDEDRAYYEERLHESAERLSGIDPERPCSRSRV